MYKKVKIVVERINELLSLEEEPTYVDTSNLSLVDGSIYIKNLSFSLTIIQKPKFQFLAKLTTI